VTKKPSVRVLNIHACATGVYIPAGEVALAFVDMAETVKQTEVPLTPADIEAALRQMAALFAEIVEDYEMEMAMRRVRSDVEH